MGLQEVWPSKNSFVCLSKTSVLKNESFFFRIRTVQVADCRLLPISFKILVQLVGEDQEAPVGLRVAPIHEDQVTTVVPAQRHYSLQYHQSPKVG